MAANKTADLFRKIARRALAPIPKTTVSEWADTYRELPSWSAVPGKWRTENVPYQKEVMDALTDSELHVVALMWAAQGGKSEVINNAIGRFAHLDPCPIMMIQPTLTDAEDYSKRRIAPMIQETSVLRELFSDPKSRNTTNTILSKFFPGGSLNIAGANSPSGLASKPIRLLMADETDRYPDSAGTEGDPIEIAKKRTTTYWNWFLLLTSTPLDKGASRIEDEYLAGTQEEWQHRCPNCGEYHVISHEQMHCESETYIDNKKEKHVMVKTVAWHCPDCGFAFTEQEMKRAPQKYVAQNPDAIKAGRRSFYVNAFSYLWTSWETVMSEWLEAQGDPEKEKAVYNTRFGLPYERRGEFTNEKEFLQRREEYGAELPDGVLLLTMAVDTQDTRLEYEVKGWGYGEECWGIQKGIILGVPDDERVWQELDKIIDRSFYFKDGKSLRIRRTFVDSGGHYTDEVYKYAKKNVWRQVFAIKGSSVSSAPLIHKYTFLKDKNVYLVHIGVDSGKQHVMDRLTIKEPGPKYLHFALDVQDDGSADAMIKDIAMLAKQKEKDLAKISNKVGYVVRRRGYDDAYFRALISEAKVPHKVKGRIVYQWEVVAKDKRNEALDLTVYNLACMSSLQPDWESLEKALKEDVVAAPPAKKTAKKYGVIKRRE